MAALGSKLPENESALSMQQAVNRYPWLTTMVLAMASMLFACGFRSNSSLAQEETP
jgi:hypothetical protein